jgi:hypothetical protein
VIDTRLAAFPIFVRKQRRPGMAYGRVVPRPGSPPSLSSTQEIDVIDAIMTVTMLVGYSTRKGWWVVLN